MKLILGTVLLLLIAGPEAAFATFCNVDDMGQRSQLSATDDRTITSELMSKGYIFDEAAPIEFTMFVEEGSSLPLIGYCTRTVSFYGPRVFGQLASRPLYKVSKSAVGLTGEWACATAISKVMSKVPSCEEMRKLVEEDEMPEDL